MCGAICACVVDNENETECLFKIFWQVALLPRAILRGTTGSNAILIGGCVVPNAENETSFSPCFSKKKGDYKDLHNIDSNTSVLNVEKREEKKCLKNTRTTNNTSFAVPDDRFCCTRPSPADSPCTRRTGCVAGNHSTRSRTSSHCNWTFWHSDATGLGKNEERKSLSQRGVLLASLRSALLFPVGSPAPVQRPSDRPLFSAGWVMRTRRFCASRSIVVQSGEKGGCPNPNPNF